MARWVAALVTSSWRATRPTQAFVVIDGDSSIDASELCEVELTGFW